MELLKIQIISSQHIRTLSATNINISNLPTMPLNFPYALNILIIIIRQEIIFLYMYFSKEVFTNNFTMAI